MDEALADAVRAMRAIAEGSAREAEAWRDKRTVLIDAAVVREKERLRGVIEVRLDEAATRIKNRVVREFSELYAENEAVRSYVALKPAKARLITDADRELQGAPAKHKSAPSAFEEDHAEILERMREAGVDVDALVVWADGSLYLERRFIRPGDAVGVWSATCPGQIVQMRVVRVTRDQMSLAEDGHDFLRVITPADLEGRRYTFIDVDDDQ